MDLKDYSYELPERCIAQHPLEQRDHSRLLLVDRATGELEHKHFYDIVDELTKEDILVVNDSRVLPARLFGSKRGTQGKAEFLLLRRKNLTDWEVMVKPAKRLKKGAVVDFSESLYATVTEEMEEGLRTVRFTFDGVFEDILNDLGEMPLPPYIKETLRDKERYQTVYSKTDGSAAAPTAGLHFTEELLQELKERGVTVCSVTLHVGLGTFRPVQASAVEDHRMHSEYYVIEEAAAELINRGKCEGKRIVSVGTTTTRCLESAAVDGYLKKLSGWTDIFIYPPYSFQIVDALITNFHLPLSTLLMLVSAFSEREHILRAYETAVREGYRFFSFGDAMFLRHRKG